MCEDCAPSTLEMASVSPVAIFSSCTYPNTRQWRAPHITAVMLLEVGGRLLEQGQHTEALTAFEASFRALHSMSGDSTADLYCAKQHLLQSSAVTVSLPPVDTYHEDECDVGPRPFFGTLRCGETTAIDVLQLAICYNQALVHHHRREYAVAMQLYSVITGTINLALANNLPSIEVLRMAMQAYNNMGHISYTQHSEEVSLSHFQQAISFAKRIEDVSNDHLLEYATVLSNWCRVQWMIGYMSPEVYSVLEDVLRIRFSILGWDHVDVASAHYNLGMAEYSRYQNEAALCHFMTYLTVSAHRSNHGMEHLLDPIPGLVYVLLIKNEHKQDKSCQDLVWGLRALQEKRSELGPDHPEVASILNFVGTLLFHLKELDHALLFFQEELRLEEELMVKGQNVSVSVTCNNIGRILQELGRFTQAIHYYKRSLKLKFDDCDADHECAKGKYDVSSSLAGACYHDSDLPPATMNLYSTVWYNLGLIHDKLGAFADAIKAFQMSLKLRRAMLGHNHADVACLLYNIGVLQMEQQLLPEATDCFREALRIRKVASTGQLNDRHVVKTLQKLSTLHKAKGDLAGALEACDGVTRVLKASSDFDEVSRMKHLGSTLRDIAELYHAQGDLKRALEIAFDSAHTLRSLRQEQGATLTDQLGAVEQETATLLLIGSLQHEECNASAAHATFAEAASMIHDSVISHDPSEAASLCALLLPLYEVSSMLASAHCAPEA
jgi:tetratricopeptide (TPR) repeat protein